MLAAHQSEDIELVDVWVPAKLHNWFLLSRIITVQSLHSNDSGKEKLGATNLGQARSAYGVQGDEACQHIVTG